MFKITILAAFLLSTPLSAREPDTQIKSALEAAIAGEHRAEVNKARDVYRRPSETLSFFGLQSDMTVVEIWPGTGWYTEILAPVLKDEGHLVAAHIDPDQNPNPNPVTNFPRLAIGTLYTMMAQHPGVFNNVEVRQFAYPYDLEIAPPGTVDMVLSFRNVHNWVSRIYKGGHFAPLAFRSFHEALKPGGILGITDHRLDSPEGEDPQARFGYMSEESVIKLAQEAGFELVGRSDVNANPKDTKDYPAGVWALPPTLGLQDQDREKYLAIGESDRMTLKFMKPVKK